jgi:peptidoglycan/LPS O-acetylase OafA/YrhL
MQRYPYIDVLRGIAAVLVIWYHVIVNSGWAFPSHGIYQLPLVGWIGVDLFFVISGFVIGKAAMEGCDITPHWRATFIERRARRIVPLYVATCVVYLFLVDPSILRLGRDSVVHVLSHVFFVQNLWPHTSGSINGPNWSVALEVQFYLLIAALAWRYATTLIWPPGHSDTTTQRVMSTYLPGTLDQFAMGVVLAKLAMAGNLQFRPLRFAFIVASAAALLSASWLIFWPRSNYWYMPEMVIFWRTLVSVGLAALLAAVVMLPWSPTRWSRPFRYLGEISYGLYLWHLPILLTLLDKTPWKGYRLLCATIVFTSILAAASWHGFEKLWIKPRRFTILDRI